MPRCHYIWKCDNQYEINRPWLKSIIWNWIQNFGLTTNKIISFQTRLGTAQTRTQTPAKTLKPCGLNISEPEKPYFVTVWKLGKCEKKKKKTHVRKSKALARHYLRVHPKALQNRKNCHRIRRPQRRRRGTTTTTRKAHDPKP